MLTFTRLKFAMETWTSVFTNDPYRDFELYLELVEGENARGQIVRDENGDLYFIVFTCPNIRVPYKWLVSLLDRADTLPRIGIE